MMRANNKIIRIVLLVTGICITWIVMGHVINKTYHERIKAKKKMYCYEHYLNAVNPVLFVKSERYSDSLIAYYRKIENGEVNPTFNFPPLSLPYDTCVYVLGYERDSLIAKVICYYDWGKQGSFVKGYVYINTLHVKPPPDSLVKRH